MDLSSPSRSAQSDATAFRKPSEVVSEDAQLRNAVPLESATAAFRDSAGSLAASVQLLMQAYAERPALGRRATRAVADPASGRTTLELLPRFETITYAEMWEQAGAVSAEWARDPGHPVGDGDFVAMYGFTSADYTVLDLACLRSGAVSVPLPSGAPAARLLPVVDDTAPRILAASAEVIDQAVELVLSSASNPRLVVFDLRPEADGERERFEAARARLAAAGLTAIDTLTAVIARGRTLPPVPPHQRTDAEGHESTPRLLVHTSGSTGTPKGAIYTEKMLKRLWTGSVEADGGLPWITVQYMPQSHVAGRTALYHTLGRGGTAYFTAKSDVSTLFADTELVRPTMLMLVPRVCDMLFHEYQNELDTRAGEFESVQGLRDVVTADLRERRLGGRVLGALCGSAPLSPELKRFVESCLRLPLHDSYGSTEAGNVMVDSRVQMPPVTEYKLADVPELGYFSTDLPYPRGELLIKSEFVTPGYHNRPEATAQLLDENGFYRTGDIMARTGPDQLAYVDRRNNVLKLAQGEFVALSRLESVFSTSPLVRQIYVYGSSERAFLLAVVVPSAHAAERFPSSVLKRALGEALHEAARHAGLEPYEIPRDFLIEDEPFTTENGLLSELRKNLHPRLKERYGEHLERLYDQMADGRQDELRALREAGARQPLLTAVSRAAAAVLGRPAADLSPATRFTDLGADSLAALSLSNLLRDVFGVEVPVDVLTSPGNSLRAVAEHIEKARDFGEARLSAATVHGPRARVARAVELTLDRFIDADTLKAAGPPTTPTTPTTPPPTPGTILLTGANGYLGRFLCLDWLERLDAGAAGGRLVCIVRGRDDADARLRLDAAFGHCDAELTNSYRDLASRHLTVVAGDISRTRLGLDEGSWRRLAEDADLVVHPAAQVNHVLPYGQLFGPNVVGTAEVVRLALTAKPKPVTYLSSIGVATGLDPSRLDEHADIREVSPERELSDAYANGYAATKWAGEVILREAHDLCGLPVTVLRSDMILAHPCHAGQLNVTDQFTRLMLSLVATGIAPTSFYRTDVDGTRRRAHYDGLPVDFVARAVNGLGARAGGGFRTYNAVNPHDDGVSLDTFVDWLAAAGHRIERVAPYGAWLTRFETALRKLPEPLRGHSVLPLLDAFRQPGEPVDGSRIPAREFAQAIRVAGDTGEIPHLTADLIAKYTADLTRLGLL
ncbi:carboxylic acid reductase [Yinghuangia sp. YIM S09857]|uniref:carboxylic acid reductase n=1 Tax=Yinghuangia sp. YIM S09857 TaxID=3436929 RepID=UPI003F532459